MGTRQSSLLENSSLKGVDGRGSCSIDDDQWGEGKVEEGEDSPRSSSACLITLVLLLSVLSSAVQLILMFSHQFPNAFFSLNSLGITNAGSLKSPSTFIFLATFIDASSRIISTLDLFDISGESGGLPLGWQFSDPGPASQARLDFFQATISSFFSLDNSSFPTWLSLSGQLSKQTNLM